jgi:hypothetical protein
MQNSFSGPSKGDGKRFVGVWPMKLRRAVANNFVTTWSFMERKEGE